MDFAFLGNPEEELSMKIDNLPQQAKYIVSNLPTVRSIFCYLYRFVLLQIRQWPLWRHSIFLLGDRTLGFLHIGSSRQVP